MTAKAKTNTRLTEELPETAKDIHASGVMDTAAFEKITMRRLGDISKVPTAAPITPDDIRMLRERADMG